MKRLDYLSHNYLSATSQCVCRVGVLRCVKELCDSEVHTCVARTRPADVHEITTCSVSLCLGGTAA